MLEIASVERSDGSKTAISPKHSPGFKTASASSPVPGRSREIRTSPFAMMYRRSPLSPSLKMYWSNFNSWTSQISETRATSSSSRSLKISDCLMMS